MDGTNFFGLTPSDGDWIAGQMAREMAERDAQQKFVDESHSILKTAGEIAAVTAVVAVGAYALTREGNLAVLSPLKRALGEAVEGKEAESLKPMGDALNRGLRDLKK